MSDATESFEPADVEALRTIVARCAREGKPIAIAGGGTLRGIGRRAAARVIVSTRALTGIVAYEPGDLTMGALSGTTLAQIRATLATHGQFLPLDAPFPERATLGGTVAAAWPSPRRHRYGAVRDLVIGIHVVLAGGTDVKAGGMVVKNVTGYDVGKLHIGAHGTLGILWRINVKTVPLPSRARAILAPLPEGTGARAVGYLHALSVEPHAAWWITGFEREIEEREGEEGLLAVRFEGSEATIERATRDLRMLLGKAGVPSARILDAEADALLQRIVNASVTPLGERSVTYRLGGLPSHAVETMRSFRSCARDHALRADCIVDLCNGDVIIRACDLDAVAFAAKAERFDDAVHALAPNAVVIACENAIRDDLAVWGTDAVPAELFRRVKDAYDPDHLLNPGVFVGGI